MRKWFPSEFTWRLYVVFQVTALIFSALVVLALLADGVLLYKVENQPVYEEIEVDPVKFQALKAGYEKLSDEPKQSGRFLFERTSPREDCLSDLERSRYRVAGREFTGINVGEGYLIVFLLAFVVPFVVVRVPIWLWEGWHSDR